MIKWVYGNTLTLVVDMYLLTVDGDDVTKEAYTPPSGSVATMKFVGRFNTFNFGCEINGTSARTTDNGTLPCGTYGVELTVQESDTSRRSFKCATLQIVRSDDELELGEFITVESIAEMEAVFIQGKDGKSAYEVAVENGYEGTETEWLASLKGDKGDAFTYEDFTEEQIATLQRPATEAAATANEAAADANEAAEAANNAATNASRAAESAESAAESANSAASSANTATTNANDATSNANSAASAANEKAALADEKASLANTKAELANTAAGTANSAAENANTKATLANEKAELADSKATLANNKAELANTAAEAANTAAENANDKATLANEAATNADNAKDACETATQNANTATEGAENVNATLVNGVMTITDRNGNETTADFNQKLDSVTQEQFNEIFN